MTIENDVFVALVGVAGGKRFPEFVPEDTSRPFVVIRVTNFDPIQTLNRSEQSSISTFVMECYADTKETANVLARAAMTAILTSSIASLKNAWEEQANGDNYEPTTLELMTLRQFSVLHPT